MLCLLCNRSFVSLLKNFRLNVLEAYGGAGPLTLPYASLDNIGLYPPQIVHIWFLASPYCRVSFLPFQGHFSQVIQVVWPSGSLGSMTDSSKVVLVILAEALGS